ncbi:MAG: thiamine biosynthesis protein ApbE [Thaumarchaeota archaeon]|nr:thiamine biosynthesis protein ApbE [Nitrososphaerota archaeon]|tara:strand:- start:5 stop:1036 length:1032 start_codon:yes stop_codon:yes gene_type:complete
MKQSVTRRNFLRVTAIGTGILVAGGIGIKQLLSNSVPEFRRHSETRELLGTLITITLIDTDESRAVNTVESTFAEIERLSGLLSRHDFSSELSHLNNDGRLIGASSELISVLKRARYYAELTGGAFDVTVGPLVDLYSAHFARYHAPPDATAVAGAQQLVDYRMITIKGSDVTLAKPGMGITLDGIGKGYVVDQAVALLKARGMARVLVEAGGDLALRGLRQDGHPWRVGIHHPRALSGYYQVLEQSSGAVATSGDYEAAFTADFRYHHIVDPRTGSSPMGLSSVTVLAGDAASADALSTAALVLGMTEGLKLLEQLPGVEALLIDKQVTSRATSGFPVPIAQ